MELDVLPTINPIRAVQAVIHPPPKTRNQSVPRTLGRSITRPGPITESDSRNDLLTLERQFDQCDGRESFPHTSSTYRPNCSIQDLPTEIQGAILDYIFGDLACVAPISTTRLGTKISAAMRHPRRRELSDMALVSGEWRHLVQERIFRHIKIKATKGGLQDSQEFFLQHGHLTQHVRHIEVWIPIWGDRSSVPLQRDVPQMSLQLQQEYQDNTGLLPNRDSSNLSFKLSRYNATLSEIFRHVSFFFPNAQIFTLEGGHCINSPLVGLFVEDQGHDSLDCLPQVKTLALKGAWNIVRDYERWRIIENALPNLQAWHCSYPDSRFENYALFWKFCMQPPSTVRLLDFNMSSLRTKETTTFYNDKNPGSQHVCRQLGKMVPQLQGINYSGRICSDFFTVAAAAARESKSGCKLKSVDFVVSNCCRTTATLACDDNLYNPVYDRAPGQFNLDFIRCFERLVVSCIRSLKYLPLKDVRIRFIDFESACPQLNPYFSINKNLCSGIWNEEILELLPQVRPGLQYANLEEGLANPIRKEDGPTRGLFPLRRPRSIKSSTYRVIAESRV